MAKAKSDKKEGKQVDKVIKEHDKVKKKIAEAVKEAAEIDKAIKQVKNGQLELMELQQMYQRHTKALQMTSDLMKKQHANAMNVIRNMDVR